MTDHLQRNIQLRMIEVARTVAGNAHAPYSKFGVGAAVLLTGDKMVSGCNMENASYGLTICAETVALSRVNAKGLIREVRQIAIAGGPLVNGRITGKEPVRPCGRCRQVISEAAQLCGHDILIHCVGAEGQVIEEYRISELLPHAFGPNNLGIH